MKKKKICVTEAVGTVLAHDLTEIVPGKYKGVRFRKGHIVLKKDLSVLRNIGKEHLWVLKLNPNEIHEDDAALLFRRLAGENIRAEGPREGKITFRAQRDGLLLVEEKTVHRINQIPQVVLATRHNYVPVKQDAPVGGIRIVPLAIAKKSITRVLRAVRVKKPLRLVPFNKKKIGLIITGNEIAKGRIKDRFRPVITAKLRHYGSRLQRRRVITDDAVKIAATIREFARTCNMIIITGGMSVDPDDVTRLAIRSSGAKIVSYGAPVLPGNMLLTAYRGEIPIIGVPACGIFHMTTSFDIFLPLLLADIKLTRTMIQNKGYGGFCPNCLTCRYPDCALGK